MRPFNTVNRGQIVQWAFVLPEEKLGACRDMLAMGTLTGRQWVLVYEAAANAANLATDALEVVFGHRPSVAESNAEVVVKMAAELIDALGLEATSALIEDLKQIGIMIAIRNKSMHKQSQILRIGNEHDGRRALELAERYVDWVRQGVVRLTGIKGSIPTS